MSVEPTSNAPQSSPVDAGSVDAGSVDAVSMRRARYTVAYRGEPFRGFAPSEGVATVVGTLTSALETILRAPVTITGAGRTDAGVHAWGQVITVDLPSDVDLEALALRVNKLCRPNIAVRDPEWVDDDFDARFSATSRTYRYHVWNDQVPNPLLGGLVWQVPHALDLGAIEVAAAQLVGEHDFSSFCRRPRPVEGSPPASMRRIMHRVVWERIDESPLLRCTVVGSAFCHQQVRSMVGTCVDVGLGRIPADAIGKILAARDRNAAGQIAPSQGLVLWHVGYDGARWDAPVAESPESIVGDA